MSKFVKLHWDFKGEPIWLNIDHIASVGSQTVLMDNEDDITVRETDEEIMSLIDEAQNDNGFRWIDAEKELPDNPEEYVLVEAWGESGETTLIGAYELAVCDDNGEERRWFLESSPDAIVKIKHWAHIPDAPEDD